MTTKDDAFWAEIDKDLKPKIVKPKKCNNCNKVLSRYFEVLETGEEYCPKCIEELGFEI